MGRGEVEGRLLHGSEGLALEDAETGPTTTPLGATADGGTALDQDPADANAW